MRGWMTERWETWEQYQNWNVVTRSSFCYKVSAFARHHPPTHIMSDGSIVNYVTHGEHEYSDPLSPKNEDLSFVLASTLSTTGWATSAFCQFMFIYVIKLILKGVCVTWTLRWFISSADKHRLLTQHTQICKRLQTWETLTTSNVYLTDNIFIVFSLPEVTVSSNYFVHIHSIMYSRNHYFSFNKHLYIS
jgi:hypothetical protein